MSEDWVNEVVDRLRTLRRVRAAPHYSVTVARSHTDFRDLRFSIAEIDMNDDAALAMLVTARGTFEKAAA